MDLSDRIRKEYPAFNKTRRKIADYILEYPEKCSFLSLKDIAEQSGVTQVTLLSFCRDMGYKNFAEFKQELQSDLIATVEVRSRIKLAHGAGKSADEMYDQIVKFSHQMIESTYAGNGTDIIVAFAKKIAAAKHVFIAGHNITEKPARTMASMLTYQGVDARYLDNQNKEEVFSLLTAWPAGDCLLLAYGISPAGQSTLSIADFCSKLNMDILCITDKATAQLARYASVSLICSVRLMNIYNSTFTVFLMNDILSIFLSAELDKRQQNTISREEDTRLRSLFGDYDTLTWSNV